MRGNLKNRPLHIYFDVSQFSSDAIWASLLLGAEQEISTLNDCRYIICDLQCQQRQTVKKDRWEITMSPSREA